MKRYNETLLNRAYRMWVNFQSVVSKLNVKGYLCILLPMCTNCVILIIWNQVHHCSVNTSCSIKNMSTAYTSIDENRTSQKKIQHMKAIIWVKLST